MKAGAAWMARLAATLLLGASVAAIAQQSAPGNPSAPPAAASTTPKADAEPFHSATGPSSEVRALRDSAIDAIEPAGPGYAFRAERDSAPLSRDFVQQPPLIPHSVRNYEVTANFNKCMDCHSWSRARESGATKVSLTHFRDRDGRELSTVSPRRYFCLQCHVPQTEAKALIENTFRPAAALR